MAAALHAYDPTAWLWRAAVLAVCVAIALAAKVVFQVVRASIMLQRQFKGPPSSSLLLGDLMNLLTLIMVATKQVFCGHESFG
jgi:hypothetical protein